MTRIDLSKPNAEETADLHREGGIALLYARVFLYWILIAITTGSAPAIIIAVWRAAL